MIVHFPVEAAQILLFARAIGDDAAVNAWRAGSQENDPGAVVAPPTFALSSAQFDPDFVLRPKDGSPWFGSADTPSGRRVEGAAGLHAEQHFEYARPIVAGDVLEVSEREGRTWEKRSRRGGLLKFSERIAEYRDARTGSIVVTARSVWVLPEAAPTASPRQEQEK